MFKQIVVEGAYGRDYKSKAAAVADWEAGKDFRIVGGPYCSNRDLAQMAKDGYESLVIVSQRGAALAFLRLKA